MLIAGIVAMVALGALMFFFPEKCTKAEQRDDPAAIAQVKQFGKIFMIAAVVATLYALKFLLR